MSQPLRLLTLAASAILASQSAFAHGVAGPRMFISTMLIDDPAVADEASLPTFSFLPQPLAEDGSTPLRSTLGFEFSKRITERFGVAVGGGYQWLRQPGAKTINGWQNLEVTPKFQAFVSPEHEFMLSVGVSRMFARTGANGSNGAALDNEDVSSTAPQIYFGKGLGDLPIGLLRPLAITGTLGYEITDKKLKVDPADGSPINNGSFNQWTGGLSLQYSMRYLQSQVQDFGLPEFVNRLTPVAEMAWSSPASKPNNGATQFLFGVGLNYTAESYAVSVEALIPGNRQTGRNVGFIAQFHLYFDDIFPKSLGRPIADWF